MFVPEIVRILVRFILVSEGFLGRLLESTTREPAGMEGPDSFVSTPNSNADSPHLEGLSPFMSLLMSGEDSLLSSVDQSPAKNAEKRQEGGEEVDSNQGPEKKGGTDETVAASASEEKKPSSSSRRNIRKLLEEDSLDSATVEAAKEEEARLARLKEHEAQLVKAVNVNVNKSKFVMDVAEDGAEICIDAGLQPWLKPHQVDGVKFMYQATIGNWRDVKRHSGAGCILAHCMGLGKSLQVHSCYQIDFCSLLAGI